MTGTETAGASRSGFIESARVVVSAAVEQASRLLRAVPVTHVSRKDLGADGQELVSDLDRIVEKLLLGSIRQAFPDVPVLAEETSNDFAQLDEDWCFVVDPIDGTKELIEGRDGFAVSVALVERRRPQLAWLDFPARRQSFFARRGFGAQLNGASLRPSSGPPAAIACSPRQSRERRFEFVQQKLSDLEVVPTGALGAKLAGVATGAFAGAFFLPGVGSRTPVWDFAAAGLVVEESGARFTSFDGGELLSPLPNIHRTGWIAGHLDVHHDLVGRLASCR